MKNNYKDPFFEVTKFSFEEILNGNIMDQSVPEETIETDGGEEFPFG